MLTAIRHTERRLRRWMRPRKVATPLVLFPARSRVYPEPYGRVLVIGPFNYPLNLTIAPLAAALAAGNTVTLRLLENPCSLRPDRRDARKSSRRG